MAGAAQEMTAVRRAVLVLVLGAGVAGVGLAVAHPQVFASSTAEAGMPGFVWEPDEDAAVSPAAKDPVTDFAVTEDAVTEDAVTEDAVGDAALGDDAVSEDTVSDGTVSDGTVSDGTVSDGTVDGGAAIEEETGESVVSPARERFQGWVGPRG